jgi:hypothetical protein
MQHEGRTSYNVREPNQGKERAQEEWQQGYGDRR